MRNATKSYKLRKFITSLYKKVLNKYKKNDKKDYKAFLNSFINFEKNEIVINDILHNVSIFTFFVITTLS